MSARENMLEHEQTPKLTLCTACQHYPFRTRPITASSESLGNLRNMTGRVNARPGGSAETTGVACVPSAKLRRSDQDPF